MKTETKVAIVIVVTGFILGGFFLSDYFSSSKTVILPFSWVTGIFDEYFGEDPTEEESKEVPEEETIPVASSRPKTEHYSTDVIFGLPDELKMDLQIPETWRVEFLPLSQSINFYEPRIDAKGALEKSQIIVKYFEGDDFTTPFGAMLTSTENTNINGLEARSSTIVAKPGSSPFPLQPSWRDDEHFFVQVRTSNQSPALFISFAKRPDLHENTFFDVVNSARFVSTIPDEAIFYPMTNFSSRVTLKSFGTHVSPGESPVSPERFEGYHTGVDAETETWEESSNVPVYAIDDGIVTYKQTTPGYGGVIIIEHEIEGELISTLYGHVKIDSVKLEVGDLVEAGDQLAELGVSGSSDTDGERQHLHLGMRPGHSVDVLGYTKIQDQLLEWLDPMEVLESAEAMNP